MLAQQRRRHADGWSRAAHFDREAKGLELAFDGMLNLNHGLTLTCVIVVERLDVRVDRAGRNASRQESINPLVGAPVCKNWRQIGGERVAVLYAILVVEIARITGEVATVNDIQES